mmetsp:Transcript_11301/g.21490  ORF Transcript_11301/g.21490 Transcript_11301/m.21490 type:complete len:305 (-) Transcript_11301:673-1587(-)
MTKKLMSIVLGLEKKKARSHCWTKHSLIGILVSITFIGVLFDCGIHVVVLIRERGLGLFLLFFLRLLEEINFLRDGLRFVLFFLIILEKCPRVVQDVLDCAVGFHEEVLVQVEMLLDHFPRYSAAVGVDEVNVFGDDGVEKYAAGATDGDNLGPTVTPGAFVRLGVLAAKAVFVLSHQEADIAVLPPAVTPRVTDLPKPVAGLLIGAVANQHHRMADDGVRILLAGQNTPRVVLPPVTANRNGDRALGDSLEQWPQFVFPEAPVPTHFDLEAVFAGEQICALIGARALLSCERVLTEGVLAFQA